MTHVLADFHGGAAPGRHPPYLVIWPSDPVVPGLVDAIRTAADGSDAVAEEYRELTTGQVLSIVANHCLTLVPINAP